MRAEGIGSSGLKGTHPFLRPAYPVDIPFPVQNARRFAFRCSKAMVFCFVSGVQKLWTFRFLVSKSYGCHVQAVAHPTCLLSWFPGENGSGRGPDAGCAVEFKGTDADWTRAGPFPPWAQGSRLRAICKQPLKNAARGPWSQTGIGS
eukprot:gene16447-biopygen20285